MQARKLPAGHGMVWLIAGLRLFRANPPALTALTFSYLLLVILLNIIPGIGPVILPLALPALTAMLGNGCRAIERGRTFTPQLLAEGLQSQRGPMLQLGGLHLFGSALLVVASLGFNTPLELGDGMSEEEAAQMVRDFAFLLVLATPLLMAFWFAPLLTLWDGVPAAKSVFFSFVASWRNWRPFTVYALLVMAVGALIPGGLLIIAGMAAGDSGIVALLSIVLRMILLFVLAPVLVASVYLSYRDVFGSAPAAAANDSGNA